MESVIKTLLDNISIPRKAYGISRDDRFTNSGKAVYMDKAMENYVPKPTVTKIKGMGYDFHFVKRGS